MRNSDLRLLKFISIGIVVIAIFAAFVSEDYGLLVAVSGTAISIFIIKRCVIYFKKKRMRDSKAMVGSESNNSDQKEKEEN